MPDYISNTPSNAEVVSIVKGSIGVDPNLPDRVSPLDVDLLNNKQILPPFDYTNLDFSSIKLQLLNLLKANSKTFGYSLRDFSDSNTAGMMLNIVAYTGQLLSYHMDSMVNELHLDTAQTSWATFKLLNLLGYKPTRPIPGVILLSVTRKASTAFNGTIQQLEDSSEILFSSSVDRRRFTFGTEAFEIFPAKQSPDGTMVPDLLGDFVIPPYVSSTVDSPDTDYSQIQKNTYFCFGLTGRTIIENYISNGTENQTIKLSNGPVNNSKVLVQIEDTTVPKVAGTSVYNTWSELSYLSLAGFRSNTDVSSTSNSITPYLVSTFKLSDSALKLKNKNLLLPGTIMSLSYDNVLDVANYAAFKDLLVPYQTCILVNATSEKRSGNDYVDVLLYHPSYIYGEAPEAFSTLNTTSTLTNYVFSEAGEKLYWSPGDILYLLAPDKIVSLYDASGNLVTCSVPHIVSESQILLASSAYEDIIDLRLNPDNRIAIGRALSSNTLAFGISADISTSIVSDNIYEVAWDGDFYASVKFGNGIFGNIPEKGSNIRIVYRIDDAKTTGDIISAGASNQTISVGNVDLFLRNDYDSSPALAGETPALAKEVATRFFSSQDRAVTGSDYTILTKKYNSNYKVTTSLAKADSDGSVVRLYLLAHRSGLSKEVLEPLTLIEKLQLREYLNTYKCLGVSLELVDGILRPLELRIDARIKPGYLAGQVKADMTSIINNFFSLKNMEMGLGFKASEFIKQVSSVSGLSTCDFYFGGLQSIDLGNGTYISVGNKVYQHLKDIPSYTDSEVSFPDLGSSIYSLNQVTSQVNPYEILVLDKVTINMASR